MNDHPDITSELAEKAIVLEAWFARPTFRISKVGDLHGAILHFAADDWAQYIKTYPRNSHIRIAIWAVEDEEAIRHEAEKKQPKPAKPEKGDYGLLWRSLFACGFQHCPGIREEIDANLALIDPDELAAIPQRDRAKEAMRRIFDTDSLTMIGPDAIRARFPDNLSIDAMLRSAERSASDRARTKEAA